MTDYAIARRIVDLHRLQEEHVERVYTPDQIQRYLTFARQFKPMVGHHLTVDVVLLQYCGPHLLTSVHHEKFDVISLLISSVCII